jgi:hypothetical protein
MQTGSAWPTTSIGKSGQRFLVGGEGAAILYNETTGTSAKAELLIGNQTTHTANGLSYGYIEAGNADTADFKSSMTFGTLNASATKIPGMTLNDSGDLAVIGALSKGSGSFKIDHPLKPDTHHLVHSFTESPRADLIYRGTTTLSNGSAVVNIDTAAGMTEGTFVALCRDVQCFTSNESDWAQVRGSVSGNVLTIECQDPTSTATVSWLVIGERQDPHMYATDWTDDNGRVIVEPEKVQP